MKRRKRKLYWKNKWLFLYVITYMLYIHKIPNIYIWCLLVFSVYLYITYRMITPCKTCSYFSSLNVYFNSVIILFHHLIVFRCCFHCCFHTPYFHVRFYALHWQDHQFICVFISTSGITIIVLFSIENWSELNWFCRFPFYDFIRFE